MKKIAISSTNFIGFGAFMLCLLLFSYCRQENSLLIDVPAEKSNLEIGEKIAAFEARLHSGVSATDRDNNLMPVNDAVWHIEALINARYAHADKPFEYASVKTDTFSLAVDANGNLSSSTLSSFFTRAKERTANNLAEIVIPEKHIVLVDVRSISGGTSIGQLFEVTSVIGFSEKTPPIPAPCDGIQNPPFTSGDDWWFGFKRGKCCLTGFNGSDAAEELEKKLNARYPLPSGHSYFTDLETTFIDPNNYQNPNANGNDPLHFYLLYNRGNPTAPQWHQPTLRINPEDMNWYYCNWWKVIGDIRPVNKNFVSINIKGDATTTYTTTLHWGWVTYGVSHQCISDSPCDIKYPNCPETTCF